MKKILTIFRNFGINIPVFIKSIKGLGWYFKSYRRFKKQLRKTHNNDFAVVKKYPIIIDRYDEGGSASGHYFHQDLWVAQRIFSNKPKKHVDIGSRIDGFVAHVASFREVEMFDIRPVSSVVSNMKFVQADLMEMNEGLINYTDSLSCLHAIEHFGLGRYNDPINPNGHVEALVNMFKILERGGTFYFSTPIGPQRVEFNAQRVFNLDYLLHIFKGVFEIKSFCYVDDQGKLYKDVQLSEENVKNNFKCNFGCGIFEMVKL